MKDLGHALKTILMRRDINSQKRSIMQATDDTLFVFEYVGKDNVFWA